MSSSILILIGIVVGLFYLINKLLSAPKSIENSSKVMVKCKECGLNLLKSEALKESGDWFCSSEHLPKN